MRNFKKLLAAGAFLTAVQPLAAQADTIPVEDPLHLLCSGCVPGASNTPLAGDNQFTVASAPPGQNGDLFLIALIPTNQPQGAPTFTGAGTAIGSPGPFTTGLLAPVWNSGTLEGYFAGLSGGPFAQFAKLGNGNPTNPFSNFIGATVGVDPGATGYDVYIEDIGTVTGLPGPNGPPEALVGADIFTLASGALPVGSFITAVLINSDTSKVVETASSSSLFVDPTSAVPLPATVGLFGTGLVGLGMLSRRRKARTAAA